ncbi:UB domain containing [Cryptosporidium sp. chipmunk genotype I]|uniref:UB domain containing n=1 Tax=Cryptosporidium sp. chipmunk genotype I TaxID=1280935 RepID=UPI00351A5DBE|nr:UB domain containing [Cryptosporidium sp. chipmunk genotype I]
MNREENPSGGSSEEVPQGSTENQEGGSGGEVISEDWNAVEEDIRATDSMHRHQDQENNLDSGIQASSSMSSENYVVVGSSENEISAEKKFKIVVRPLNGRDLTVEASQTSTIRQLKVLIEVQSGIEAINQRLIFRGRCMLDDDTVGTYIKEDGVIIHLVPYARNQRNEDSAQSVSESRPRAPGTGGTAGNIHNLFTTASGIPGLSTSIGGFPGAMMFGAIRLDGETGLPMEAEDLMQRVLRTFGDAVNGSGVDPTLVNISPGSGDNRNLSSVTFNSFAVGQPTAIPGFSGLVSGTERSNPESLSFNNETNRSTASTSNDASTNNVANSSVANTETEGRRSSNISSSNIDHTRNNAEHRSNDSSTRAQGSFRGSNRESIRGDPMNSNPIGRIGTIVSRIFQAFNQPVGGVQEVTPGSEARATQVGAGTGIEAVTRTDAGASTNLGSVTVHTGTSERTSRNNSQDVRGRVISGPTSGLSWTQIASSGSLNNGRTGVLPIGRPGLAVATIPISNFSIPITIRATSSTGIPSINLSQSSNAAANVAAATQGDSTSARAPTDAGNTQELSSNVSEVYRASSNSFFRNISNVLEESANQLRTVAVGIREMSGLERPNGSEQNQGNSSSSLPPIPSSVSSRSISGENLTSGQTSDYIQHHSHRLYISNEVVHRFLPWDSLNELMDVLERDCGWRRPRITIPPPVDSMDASPLAVFISVYLQAMSIVQSNLMQIQAWQERFARLDIPRLCYTVHLLALISHISAHLGSLLAWLFQNMAQYVEQDRLIEGLQWNRSSNEIENSGDIEDNQNASEEAKRMDIDEETPSELIGEDALNNANLKQDNQVIQNDTESGANVLERNGSSFGFNIVTASSPSNLSSGPSNEEVINQLPKEIREKWERWTGNPQNFSRNVFASFSTRPFSDTYQQGDVFSSSSSFGFSQPSNENGNISGSRINSHPTSQELLRMIIHQTEANLNISNSNSRNYTNIQDEYRSMLVRDLINIARNDSDFLNNRSRFPYLQRIISLLYE